MTSHPSTPWSSWSSACLEQERAQLPVPWPASRTRSLHRGRPGTASLHGHRPRRSRRVADRRVAPSDATTVAQLRRPGPQLLADWFHRDRRARCFAARSGLTDSSKTSARPRFPWWSWHRPSRWRLERDRHRSEKQVAHMFTHMDAAAEDPSGVGYWLDTPDLTVAQTVKLVCWPTGTMAGLLDLVDRRSDGRSGASTWAGSRHCAPRRSR